MLKDKRQKYITVTALIIMVSAMIACNRMYRSWCMLKSKSTIGIYVGRTGGRADNLPYFEYKDRNGVKAEAMDISGKEIGKLRIGDTVWLNYSLRDGKLAELVSLDYKKYYKK